jgi:hypothetical protein
MGQLEKETGMTPEAKVKEKIKKILRSYSIWYAMPHGAGYGNAGVPDFLCCHQGKFIAIEAKAGKGKATALQLSALETIKRAGGIAWLVNEDNLDLFEEHIKETSHD